MLPARRFNQKRGKILKTLLSISAFIESIMVTYTTKMPVPLLVLSFCPSLSRLVRF